MARMGVAAALALSAAIALASAAGCGGDRAGASVDGAAAAARGTPAPARPAPGTPPRGVVRVFSMVPSDTIRLSPPERPPEPTAEYASLEAVLDSLVAVIRGAATPGDTAIHVTSGPVRFKYWYLPDSASGYLVHVVVTDTSSCPDVEVEKALEAGGWVFASGYSADGPDGTVMGFVTKRYFCLIEGRWDGGDDSDPTYVPAPGCDLRVTCVPRREDDLPEY